MTPVRRGCLRAAVALGALLAVAGCSGGGSKATPTSSASSATSTTAPTTSATMTATSTPPKPTTSATTAKPTTKTSTTTAKTTPPAPQPTIAIPKVEARAQDAVNVYIGYLRTMAYIEPDPAQIRRTGLNTFLGTELKKSVNASLDALGKAGVGYRGTPPNPRLQVQYFLSSKLLLLTSCPLQSKTDPYRQVVLATGKPVNVSNRAPLPPYERTITMYRTKKKWIVQALRDDTSRTCTG